MARRVGRELKGSGRW